MRYNVYAPLNEWAYAPVLNTTPKPPFQPNHTDECRICLDLDVPCNDEGTCQACYELGAK